jgi:hypothetical protein
MGFDACTRVLNIRESIWDSNSHNGSSLGSVRVHSLRLFALPKACDVIPGSSFWPATLQLVALVVSPRLWLRQLSFGSPETKSHLDVGLAERHKVYHMGEGGGFPRIRAVVSLMSPRSPMVRSSTKSAPTLY